MGRDGLVQLERRIRDLEDRNDLLSRSDPSISLGVDLVDLGNVPTIRMRQTSSQSLTLNAWRTITLEAIDFDLTGDSADLSNNLITIRRTGIYLIIGKVSMDNTSGRAFVGYSVNSDDITSSFWDKPGAGGITARMGFVDVAELEVGDTLKLRGFTTATLSTLVDSNQQSFISITLLAQR